LIGKSGWCLLERKGAQRYRVFRGAIRMKRFLLILAGAGALAFLSSCAPYGYGYGGYYGGPAYYGGGYYGTPYPYRPRPYYGGPYRYGPGPGFGGPGFGPRPGFGRPGFGRPGFGRPGFGPGRGFGRGRRF
jgi:hypothetical protein